MQAIILAAGKSSRFWPINNQHKSQIKLLGRPLVYWTVKSLSEKGIKDIILVTNHKYSLKEEAKELFKDLDAKVSVVVQDTPSGTGNAVFTAKDLIKEPFFVLHPYKVNAGEIVEKILEKYETEKSNIILVGTKTNTPWDYGVLKQEGDKVIEIVENPEPGKEPSNIKTLGTYFLEPDFFNYYEALSEHNPEDFIDALNNYIKDKKASFIFWDKEVPSLKYPWELLSLLKIKFNSGFEKHISDKASTGKNVVINGDVYIGDNVIIGANSTISGPCYIGDNCKIGANNVFRGPVNLEKEVVTGAFCEIKNCVIEKGTHLHSGYFGDSIIGENCRFGAGFVTANRRIDRETIKSIVKGNKLDTGFTSFGFIVGANTRFGIHSGTMPGVLIGSDCSIGPGTLVFENVEDNTKYYTRFESIQKK